jgi:hypothetical protein
MALMPLNWQVCKRFDLSAPASINGLPALSAWWISLHHDKRDPQPPHDFNHIGSPKPLKW